MGASIWHLYEKNKDFVCSVVPQVKIKEIRRGEDGSVVVIKEYDHPSTGSFWDNAQDEVRRATPRDKCSVRLFMLKDNSHN